MAALLIFLLAAATKAPESQPSGTGAVKTADAEPAAAASIATGFQDRLAADAPGATALAFLPDERLLVTGREG